MNDQTQVLVTGGSGFVGSHCIIRLLQAGYRVRTSVRKLDREPQVRAILAQGGCEAGDLLSFAAADLNSDEGWDAAVGGCDYVLHVASPFPLNEPKNEDDLIIPAREGALRVLRAARDGGVKRVVLTSSFAAVGYGNPPPPEPFDEHSWTNLDGPGVGAYVKSKTIAERAAWDFIEREGGLLELSVVNPVAVLGPVLNARDVSTSVEFIKMALDGRMAMAPNYFIGVVDVRDVADLHVRCMTDPKARGERFLAITGSAISVLDMCKILKRRFGKAASKAPTMELPNWIVRVGSSFSPDLALLAPDVGKYRNATSEKARANLGWAPRSAEDAVVATAKSLFELGLV